MKAKRIAEITDDIAKLKEQIAQLSAELNIEHGATGAAALIAKAIIAREVAKGAMLYAELSAVIQAPVKKNSDQVRKKQAQEDKDKVQDQFLAYNSDVVVELFEFLKKHFQVQDSASKVVVTLETGSLVSVSVDYHPKG